MENQTHKSWLIRDICLLCQLSDNIDYLLFTFLDDTTTYCSSWTFLLRCLECNFILLPCQQ